MKRTAIIKNVIDKSPFGLTQGERFDKFEPLILSSSKYEADFRNYHKCSAIVSSINKFKPKINCEKELVYNFIAIITLFLLFSNNFSMFKLLENA